MQLAQANEVGRGLGPRLIAYAEKWFDIPQGSIQNPKRRNGDISKARWAIAHALSQTAGWSQPRIAKLFCCDASSVHNGQQRARELIRTDAIFFDAVERLQREISPE